MDTDNGTFCGEPLLNLSTRGIGHVQQCSQIKYIKGIPKKGTVDGLNISDGFVYVDGVKQELFDLRKDKWEDIWNSEYLVDLRYKQANGIKNPTCELCYFMGKESKRYRYIYDAEKYNKLYSKTHPNKIELRLSNECNLACRFCTPINSSIYEKEMVKLGKQNNIPSIVKKNYVDIAEHVQEFKKGKKFLRDVVDSSDLFHIIKHAQIIEMHGGEPTLETKLWKVLEQIDLSNKEFICYTNMIKFDQYHIDILNQFKNGRIVASIDVAGKGIEYCRYPAKWEIVSSNCNKLKQLKEQITVQFSFTLQVYNVFSVLENIKWVADNFGDMKNHELMCNTVQKPAYLCANLLPFSTRQQVIKDIETQLPNIIQSLSDDKQKNYSGEVSRYIRYLSKQNLYDSIPDKSTYKEENIEKILIDQFWDFTNTLDTTRKQQLENYFPEIKNLLTK